MSKKNVCVLGDSINDIILVRDSPWDPYHSSNPDLFTHDKVRIHQTPTGTHTLIRLLREISNLHEISNGFVILNSPQHKYEKQKNSEMLYDNIEYNLEVVSEWVEDDNNRLFLVEQIGEADAKRKMKGADDICTAIANSNIIAVYNVSDTLYCLGTDLDNVKTGCYIVFRTIFHNKEDKKERITKFLKQVSDKNMLDKTILLFDVNELRQGGSNIQKGVSWERLVKDTIRSLKDIPKYDQIGAIVVCFNYEGCLVYSKAESNPKYPFGWYKLFFYDAEIEGTFVTKEKKRVSGTIATMQASLVHALTNEKLNSLEEQLDDGVKRGLRAMKTLLKTGFSQDAEFPFKEIAKDITSDTVVEKEPYPVGYELLNQDILSIIESATSKKEKDFSIIDSITSEHSEQRITLYGICEQIVTEGKIGQQHPVPFLRYGKLITYDKLEIERLRNTYNLFCSYINKKPDKPLSICVFGPPGSGKSFAVKEIAKEITGIKDSKQLEFNMSQMKDPSELADAFHQIRDESIKGKIPIVFFDEFDSRFGGQDFGWLKYFLAPMQDGEFSEKGFYHPIGSAIFIFAGGTNADMDEFKNKAKMANPSTKARDFLSRLKGYINILGPNPMRCPYGKEIFKNKPEKCRHFANIINDIADDKFLKKLQEIKKYIPSTHTSVDNFQKNVQKIKLIIADIRDEELEKNIETIEQIINKIEVNIATTELNISDIQEVINALKNIDDEELQKKEQDFKKIHAFIKTANILQKSQRIREIISEEYAGELFKNALNLKKMFDAIAEDIDDAEFDEEYRQKKREIIAVYNSADTKEVKVQKFLEILPQVFLDAYNQEGTPNVDAVMATAKLITASTKTAKTVFSETEEPGAQKLVNLARIIDAGYDSSELLECDELLERVPKIIDLLDDIQKEPLSDYEKTKKNLQEKAQEIKLLINTMVNVIVKEDFLKKAQETKKIIDDIKKDPVLEKVKNIKTQFKEIQPVMSTANQNKIRTLRKDVGELSKEELQKKVQEIKKILPVVHKDISDNEETGKAKEHKKQPTSIHENISDDELLKLVEKLIDILPNINSSNKKSDDDFLKKVKEVRTCTHADVYCRNKQWDATYIVRRASLLRSVLEKEKKLYEKKKFKIDDTVLNAFMHVETYLYETRSLDAIVQTSELAQGKRFSSKCVNFNGLELYVDKTFKELLNEKRKYPKIGKLICPDLPRKNT